MKLQQVWHSKYKKKINKYPDEDAREILTSFEEVLALTLGARRTLPEGPLGKTKSPFSAPWAIARLSIEIFRPTGSMLYFSAANLLMVERETPRRASLGFAAMHS